VSTTAISTRIGRELSAICGAEHVTEAPPETIHGCAVSVAVQPGSPAQVAAILRFANENNLTVAPAGGFTQQQTGAAPAQVDVLLYTTRLTEVEHYDPGDLTIGIGAGCRVSQLSSMVSKDGLLFAGDPPEPERATVGGMLATGISGPLRHGYGGPREYCIGIKFVTGDGRIGGGGGRVVKNVAGYDMMKLLIGSWGTLGIITGASFKLFPAPRQTRTFVACFEGAGDALEFRRKVLRSPLDPICLELISPEAHALLIPASPTGGSWCICVRAAGSDAVLARYRTELGSAVAREMDGENEQGFWGLVRHFAARACERDANSLLLAFALPLNDVQSVLKGLQTIANSNGFTLAATGCVGVGNLSAALWPTNRPLADADFITAVSALRSWLPQDASMAVLHCPDAVQKEIGALRTPTDVESMRTVKQVLDPKDILNRGRFIL
jgi:glycolate oxidase FAD binding subunit